MSDDEEVFFVKRQKTIHYGSLEDTIESRVKQKKTENENAAPEISQTQVPEYFDIDDEMLGFSMTTLSTVFNFFYF